jgi:hypothetical protein
MSEFVEPACAVARPSHPPAKSDHRTIQETADKLSDPTRTTYLDLAYAYDFFNRRLFAGRLPRCLITMQRRRTTYGYYASARFGTADGSEITDEIAINPSPLRNLTIEDILSTLVHEQTHLEQHHFGTPGRGRYHNKKWVGLMIAVGLVPSDTGLPGGKQTGERVNHYILPGGPFDQACSELVRERFVIRYVELPTRAADQVEGPEADLRKKKAASKTRYTCPRCALNAWGKPMIALDCGSCNERLMAATGDAETPTRQGGS